MQLSRKPLFPPVVLGGCGVQAEDSSSLTVFWAGQEVPEMCLLCFKFCSLKRHDGKPEQEQRDISRRLRKYVMAYSGGVSSAFQFQMLGILSFGSPLYRMNTQTDLLNKWGSGYCRVSLEDSFSVDLQCRDKGAKEWKPFRASYRKADFRSRLRNILTAKKSRKLIGEMECLEITIIQG